MKNTIYIVIVLLMVVTLLGCAANDPLDVDIYTQSVLPGNTGDYDVGASGERYEYGYFDYLDVSENIETDGNIHAGGDLFVDGDVDISGDIEIDGDLTVDDIDADDIDADNITANGLDAIHAYTHEFNGSDELNTRDLLTALPPTFFISNYSLMTSSTNGTGWTGDFSPWRYFNMTGATVNTTSGRVFTVTYWLSALDTPFNCRTYIRTNYQTNTDMACYWWGWFNDVNVYPADTSNHWGIKVYSNADGTKASAYATSGNNSSQTTTLLFGNISAYDTHDYKIDYLYDASSPSGVKIDYYYSNDGCNTWVLGATHYTDIPSRQGFYLGAWVTNYEAENKAIETLSCKVLVGAE